MSRKLITALMLLGASSVSAVGQPTPPTGMDSWPGLIDRYLEVSYTPGQMACIHLHNDSVVEVTDVGGNKDALDYRYRIPASQQDSKLESQFDAFVGLGILARTQTQGHSEYRLLPRGWGLSPDSKWFDKKICVETGKWEVDKITQYEAVSDQHSGLNVYLVNAEKTYQEHAWARQIDRPLFGLKRMLPKAIRNLLFVQGPKGYLLVSADPSSLRRARMPLPRPEAVEAMVANDTEFLKSYCKLLRWVTERCHEECTAIEYLKYAPNIRVYYTGVPRGNISVFKFVDLSDPEAPHLGDGRLELLLGEGHPDSHRDLILKPRFSTLHQ